ncbi:hypothetical protein D3C74_333980 [compost metagenome]
MNAFCWVPVSAQAENSPLASPPGCAPPQADSASGAIMAAETSSRRGVLNFRGDKEGEFLALRIAEFLYLAGA